MIKVRPVAVLLQKSRYGKPNLLIYCVAHLRQDSLIKQSQPHMFHNALKEKDNKPVRFKNYKFKNGNMVPAIEIDDINDGS